MNTLIKEKKKTKQKKNRSVLDPERIDDKSFPIRSRFTVHVLLFPIFILKMCYLKGHLLEKGEVAEDKI